MIKKKYILILLLLIGLFAITSVSANDLDTNNNLTGIDDSNDLIASSNDDCDSIVSAKAKVIYFDSKASTNGDGSKSKPYKYVNENTLNTNSGNDITAYFADGTYKLNTPFKISSNVVLIGESREKTKFNSVLSDEYDFEIMQNCKLELNNINFNHANFKNHGTIEANNVNFENSKAFEGYDAPSPYSRKYNSSFGGVIICDPIDDSSLYINLENCIFNNNAAYSGASISLKNSVLKVKNSKFLNSQSKRQGGAIYAINSEIYVSDSEFTGNNARYGGDICCEFSVVDLKNTNFIDSSSYSFGGAIVSNYTYINVEDCNFADYSSSADAGGAIYNFKGILMINNTNFCRGLAKFGGAIANLDAELYVFSSIFENNTAEWYGGTIYNIYGAMYFEDNTFYNSHAFYGSTIRSELSDSLFFIDNIFINSTDDGYSAVFVDTAKDITQTGNFFEDEYQVYMEFESFLGNDTFLFKSNVLNYIVSNNGTYLNNYENMDSSGDSSNYVSLNIYDDNYRDDSTIFANYDDDFTINFNLNTYSDDFNFMYMQWLKFVICNGAGEIISETYYYLDAYRDARDMEERAPINNINRNKFFIKEWDYESSNLSEVHGTFSINFNQLMYLHSEELYDVEDETVSLIESSPSDLNYIPSSYDSRDYGYITPVKNQADGGNCWAFAGIATLEACIKKITNVTYDFSEENAKNIMASFSPRGLEIDTNAGGYESMMIAYLTSWFGPTLEEYDEYDDLSSLSHIYQPTFHIQNVYFLPQWDDELNMDVYKKAIMDYGAVSISLYWTPFKGYHAVCLVGWDDSFNSYDSFGDYTEGAWIIKNSWGTDWGDDGFGYLSYDTPFVNTPYTFIFKEEGYYLDNYHFDYSGVSDYICYDGPIYSEVKYYVPTLNFIDAIGTYFIVPTDYAISVFSWDELVLYQEGHSEAGYYTIPLEKSLGWGEEYTIQIAFLNDGWNYLPVCQVEELTKSHFYQKQTFCSFGDTQNWLDLYDLKEECEFLYKPELTSDTCQSLCINIYLHYFFSDLTLEMNVTEFDSVNVGEYISINVSICNPSLDDRLFIESIEDTLVLININETKYYAKFHDGKASLNISFDEPGLYKLNARYLTNRYYYPEYGLTEFYFTVNNSAYSNDIKLSAPDLIRCYSDEPYAVSLTKNGVPLANEKVSISLNNVTYIRTTDSEGIARLDLDLDYGTYTVTSSYNGIEISSKITVKSSIIANDVTGTPEDTQFSITLFNGNGTPASVPVSFTAGNVSHYAYTNDMGVVTFNLKLDEGIYPVEVTNPATSETIICKITVIGQSNINLEAKDITKYYGSSEALTVLVTENDVPLADVVVLMSLNDIKYKRTTNSKGIAKLELNMDSGTYIITSSYGGQQISSKVTVKQTIMGKDEIGTTQNTKYSVNVLNSDGSPLKNTKISFKIGSDKYSATTNDKGVATLNIKLQEGTYQIEATNPKTSEKITNKLTVKKASSDVNVEAKDLNKFYGGSERFTVKITDNTGKALADKEVNITINNKTYTKTTDADGIAGMGIGLNSKVYPVTVACEDEKVDVKVTVKATVSGKDITKIYRNDTQYYATFLDTKGNLMKNTVITFNINGVLYTKTTNDKGVACMNINLPPGTYIITAENPNSKEKYTNTIKVLSSIVENYDLTKYYRNASKYTLRILGDDGKPVGEGVVVRLNINGVFYEKKTDASGYMSMNINLPPGTYIVTAEYKGLRASNTIKVLSVLKTKDLKMSYKGGSQFEAKLLDGQGKPYAGQTVTFNINGVFYKKVTGEDGVARLTINLIAGEYIITSTYNGLNAANKVTISG